VPETDSDSMAASVAVAHKLMIMSHALKAIAAIAPEHREFLCVIGRFITYTMIEIAIK
jgi:hypothetical protein